MTQRVTANPSAAVYTALQAVVCTENPIRMIALRILEAGVGTGRNFPFYPPRCEVVGIDLSPAMLVRAECRRLMTTANVELRQMDVTQLSFPDRSHEPSGVRKDQTETSVDGVHGIAFHGFDAAMGQTYVYEVSTYKELEPGVNEILSTWR